MTEEEALDWLQEKYDVVVLERLATLVNMVRVEATHQNLIAPSTLNIMWSRHIIDSVQLEQFVSPDVRSWLDVGTGAGFPGLAIACVRDTPMTMVEPRRRRAEFLQRCQEALHLPHTSIICGRVENVTAHESDVITARAVASLDQLFTMTTPHRTLSTAYVLPRGSNGVTEVESLRAKWQGLFHVEHSITDPTSAIVVASKVRAKCIG